MIAAELELDLDVFTGPFDLLLTLVLREDVDLLEVELADVVVSYLDHLELRGELDLEVATEFLVLIAALLELKSRLMLPRADDDLLDELEPGEAAEELLARMLEARRYRRAAEHLAGLLAAEHGHRFRSAPLPPFLRRVTFEASEAVYAPERLGRAIGGLLRTPPLVASLTSRSRASASASGSRTCARCCAAASSTSTRRSRGADRVTVAVTLFALLELYKQGEATWTQDDPFGPIAITPRDRAGRRARAWRARMSRRCAHGDRGAALPGPEPVPARRTRDAAQCSADEARGRAGRARRGLRARRARAASARARRRLDARQRARGRGAARRLLAKPRTPPLSPAQAETLAIVAYLQPVSRPEITRIRGVNAESAAGTLLERGLIEESGRSQFGAVLYRTTPLFLKLFGLAGIADLPDPRVGPDARRGVRPARSPAQRGRPALRRGACAAAGAGGGRRGRRRR